MKDNKPMKDLQMKTLEDIASVKGGKRIPKGYKLQSEKTKHPYITVSDFNDKGSIDTERIRYISDEVFEQIRNYTISTKDLYISIAGTIGKTGIIPAELNGANLTENACKLVFKKDIDNKFIYYFTQTADFIIQTGLNTRTTAQPKLALERLKTIKVRIPEYSEQQRIVANLDEAFAAIAKAKENAEKNLQNARALFESCLQSIFTQHEMGGTITPLSSVLAEQPRNGWSPPAEYQTGSGNPVLTLSAVTGFKYDGTRVKLSSAPTRENAHYWLKPGELLITRSNTQELVAHVAIYDGTPERAICCDLIMKMMVDPAKALTRFVYYYLRSSEARSYLTSRAQGASATMKKIGKPVVQNIPIPLPSIEKQKEIVTQLDTLIVETKKIEAIYQQKLAALEEVKKSILHKAFSHKAVSSEIVAPHFIQQEMVWA